MPTPPQALVGIFLAFLVSVPLWQTVSDLSQGHQPGFVELFQHLPDQENLKAFECRQAAESEVVKALQPVLREKLLFTIGDAGPDILAAEDGWFFYRPSVNAATRRHAKNDSTPGSAFQAASAFHQSLAARGIRLVVVPVPNKESVYPERLSPGSSSEVISNPATREFLRLCQTGGLETLDLFSVFQGAKNQGRDALYLSQDTHWTSEGAAVAAMAVAAMLEASSRSPFEIMEVAHAETGDLVRLFRSPAISEKLGPEPRLARRIVRRGSGLPYADDPASDVLVLGDSFLRIHQTDGPGASGFIAHLAHALGSPVKSLVNEGGGATLVRQELARRPQQLDGVRVVVWVFTERDIVLDAEHWPEVPLPPSR